MSLDNESRQAMVNYRMEKADVATSAGFSYFKGMKPKD